jgi:hypothetical protein
VGYLCHFLAMRIHPLQKSVTLQTRSQLLFHLFHRLLSSQVTPDLPRSLGHIARHFPSRMLADSVGFADSEHSLEHI